ncbi:MAG: hypothetical protein Q9M37_00095 [Desulfonauticus sp.]|nr:hypothetical protein [Desulfonauticus sp.]
MHDIINSLATDFSVENLISFFIHKNPEFQVEQRVMDYEEDIFLNIQQIGNLRLQDGNDLYVYAIQTSTELTERSSKKRQYDLAKKILKDDLIQAGIFVFYDDIGNFRFSLVFQRFYGTKSEFSYYKRYTYYVQKGKPYRTFVKALIEASFDTLENIISAFSTRPLTKEFYSEIQNWFAWALKGSVFPGGVLEENLIRLITRIMFVWFLKEKSIIPEKIFNETWLKEVVKDFSQKDYYYNVVLQNLFFATLNTYPKKRGWAKDDGFLKNRATNYGVKNLFRYEKFLLVPPEDFISEFKDVPFINGGLFECLDDDKKQIDGFTRRENKRAKIPDELFFAKEIEQDLSNFYGKRKKVPVRGLITILKDYNFTADENSPVDIEVSLDPELLGHIFENLLAAYNPETQTTARKATGSYYTPKEIVDFMVDEPFFTILKIRLIFMKKK